MTAKVLVTGGAGFIGSHLVDALILRGHEVVVVDDLSAGRRGLVNPDARFYEVSVTDLDGLSRVFQAERPQMVSHHAAQKSVRSSMSDPTFDALVNVVGSVNVLQMSAVHGCERVIFASTSAVYSEPVRVPLDESHPARPQSAYGVSKLAAESYLRFYGDTYGFPYAALRYGNVYGPRQDPGGEAGVVSIFAGQILAGGQVTIYGDGSKTRDYVFVSDVVEANLAAMSLSGGGEALNIGRGVEVSDREVFELVRRAAGSDAEPVYADRRPGEADRISLDSSRASETLGWTPAVDLPEGVGRTVAAIGAGVDGTPGGRPSNPPRGVRA